MSKKSRWGKWWKKGKFTISVDSEDLPKGVSQGVINVRDNKLKKVIDKMDFIVPTSLLPALKATFDRQDVDKRIFINWRIKF